jgi:hypothetical protein
MALLLLLLVEIRSSGAQGLLTFVQVTTSSPQCVSYPPDVADDELSADGTRLVFQTTCDLTGSNPDGMNAIFLFDTTTSALTQITSRTQCASPKPVISADGSRIAFKSGCNGSGDPPDLPEIFLYDVATKAFTQVATDCNTGFSPIVSADELSADGTRFVFQTTCNLTGGNADASNEIYLFDATSGSTTQVTTTTNCANLNPIISADGSRIAFQSGCNLTGGNGDGNTQVFLGSLEAPICAGDCDGSGDVTVDEIITLVNIALGNAPVTTCEAGDANHDGQITVEEIVTAVNNALNGCGG